MTSEEVESALKQTLRVGPDEVDPTGVFGLAVRDTLSGWLARNAFFPSIELDTLVTEVHAAQAEQLSGWPAEDRPRGKTLCQIRRELVRVLRKLEAFGVGDFKSGRRGAKSRFHLHRHREEVSKVLGPPPEPSRAPAEPDASRAAAPVDPAVLTHAFALRPDLKITLDLPADLTRAEAGRLARFVEALPFEGAV